MVARVIHHRLILARGLPPGALVRRALHGARRRLSAVQARKRDRRHSSFADEVPVGPLQGVCEPVARAQLEQHRGWIERAAALYLDHRFDLLGSGWIRLAHGATCPGFEGTRYQSAQVVADPQGNWLDGRINNANLLESRRRWRLVDPDYRPIDWQLDFRSGYRWSEDCWSGDIAFGHTENVDIKLPWELARMQHLVVLAWAHRQDKNGSRFARAFRNQVLDFIATNPPRFGVNWVCAMEVAIRAANWVMAYSLFRAHGELFDAPFEETLKRSLVEHGRHVVTHLESYPEGRGNHYLADVAGLLFIAACLPAGRETDSWLAFAIQELAGETMYQFNPDGSNFEGSTCYHRLSLEMVTYGMALIAGLPSARRRTLEGDHRAALRSRPYRPLSRRVHMPSAHHIERVERAAGFLVHLTSHDGHVPQIGDNDNGRFFRPHLVYRPAAAPAKEEGFEEDHLDCRGAVAAVATLTGNPGITAVADRDRLDGALVNALARNSRLTSGTCAAFDLAAQVRVGAPGLLAELAMAAAQSIELRVPGGELCKGLAVFGYPDFGAWIFRSDRLHLTVRCGPSSSPKAGGSHAHNDQLAIELVVDGERWIADPGSYVYCPPATRRNRWRSARAHACPHWPGREPARLDSGDFRLNDETRARCLYFREDGFCGEHYGFGTPVRRIISLEEDRITIRDAGLPVAPTTIVCSGRDAVRRHFASPVPFSPGYGSLSRTGVSDRDSGA